MKLLALSNEVAHVDGARGTAEQTDGVKQSREGHDPLGFCQGTGEDGLQHDATDKSNKGKSLPDAYQQLSAVEVLGSPGAVVLRIQHGREGRTGQANREQNARIQFA